MHFHVVTAENIEFKIKVRSSVTRLENKGVHPLRTLRENSCRLLRQPNMFY